MRALVLACVLVVSACGVSSEHEPQIIEESTQQQPTPSFDTEPSPTEPSLAEPGAAEPSAAESSPAESSPAESSSTPPPTSSAEVRSPG